MKVKILHSSESYYDLEKEINEFLNEHKDINIVDIKYSSWGYGYYSEYTAMIIIEE
jgi:hypothetical protein